MAHSWLQRARNWLSSDRVPVAVALIAALLTLPALFTGWQLDDVSHRIVFLRLPDSPATPAEAFSFIKGDREANLEFMDLGVLPWWTVEELKLSFWRPITIVTHWVDYRLWPNSAGLMHLQSLIWFGGLVAIAAVLYRRVLGPTWIAGLAALLYALDDAHGYPAGWLANRNALIATTFGYLALVAHDRWRRDGWRPGGVVAPGFLALALLSAKFGAGVVAYLLAHALFLEGASLSHSTRDTAGLGTFVAAGGSVDASAVRNGHDTGEPPG